MKLILTRPEGDSKPLAQKLAQMGHTPLLAPLLKIEPRKNITISDRNWQAICFTSANAVSALSSFPALRTRRVLTVGPQSRSEALQAGFTNVAAHGGNVTGLVEYIRTALAPSAGPILYPSGAETSGDLEGQLRAFGFDVERVIAYDAVPLVPDNLTSLAAKADGVLLYSQRTALLWRALDVAAPLTHYCLSDNVAAKLPATAHRKIAATPDEDGMLNLLRSEALNEGAKQHRQGL